MTPTFIGSPNTSALSRISPPVVALPTHFNPPNVPQPAATRVLQSSLPPGQPMRASHTVFNLNHTPFAWQVASWGHGAESVHHSSTPGGSRGTSPVLCDMATQVPLLRLLLDQEIGSADGSDGDAMVVRADDERCGDANGTRVLLRDEHLHCRTDRAGQ